MSIEIENEPIEYDRLPVLPLKDVVVFPRMVIPLLIGRATSMGAVEECLATGKALFAIMQKDSEVELPEKGDLYDTGVMANILQTMRMPDGTMKIVVEGLERVKMRRYYDGENFDSVDVTPISHTHRKTKKAEATQRLILESFDNYVKQGQRISPEVAISMRNVEETDVLVDMLSAHLNLKAGERQQLLTIEKTNGRMEKLYEVLQREVDLLGIEKQVKDKVRDQMEKGQRDYFLNEQMKMIQSELSGSEYSADDVQELRQRIDSTKLHKDVKEKTLKELYRFERMQPMSPESSIVQTYIEWITDLPWKKRTKDNLSLDAAQKILDKEHYGLKKVKERILEFLAVRKVSKTVKGPILCLVGPPGVGKTSLGQSIAHAMGRKFVRVSLGGVRDEAEIRGHRRTYIGALPGRIIQSMKKVEVCNPVFMLDEIDKMNVDFRGDPSSALLEVLDPEQNQHFSDHYLEVDYDLHEVFFIATANSEYDIPEPLLDRMEIVNLSGYSPLEKVQIANQFLIPRQLKEAGLDKKGLEIKKEALDSMIHQYTQEAGVRELERQIASICRKVTLENVRSKSPKKKKNTIDQAKVTKLLGPPHYTTLEAGKKGHIGVSVGLAWTSVGGDTLIIETQLMKGKGDLRLTGQLGEVMQESAQAAYTYLRANAKVLGISSEFWKNADLHLHVPEGAIPKDGPSAGGAIAISMLSALRNKAPFDAVAMTGEITLRGHILPIGGMKEKLLAAHRAGMEKVLLPKENKKDLVDIPEEVRNAMNLVFVEDIKEVIAHTMTKPRKPAKKKTTAKKKPAKKKTK
jgi:ATP-dependent Lon protease